MNVSTFLFMLLIVSIFTPLVVQGIKMLLEERHLKYYSNTLAAIVSVTISLTVGIFYTVLLSVPVDAKLVVIIIALAFLGWLGAMIGYDKVIQAIKQIKGE